MKKKNLLIIFIIAIVALCAIIGMIISSRDDVELISIKNKKELEEIYNDNNYYDEDLNWKTFLTLPFSFFEDGGGSHYRSYSTRIGVDEEYILESATNSNAIKSAISADSVQNSSTTSDYSTTNIQVENVDEADVLKTDGEYIYSISENKVIITDVRKPEELKIAYEINCDDDIPQDLIIYNNKLVIIENTDEYTKSSNRYGYYNYNSYNDATKVEIYNIENKEQPKLIKSFEIYEPYYTTRCIEGKLYIIATGYLKKDSNDEIITYYKEDRNQIEMDLNDIKYFKGKEQDSETIIAMYNLNDMESNLEVSAYLVNAENAYISENNIYILESDYEGEDNELNILSLFGLKGVLVIFDRSDTVEYSYKTKIYKLEIQDNGKAEYVGKAVTAGNTINQFSLDEYNENLRIALYNWIDGTWIEVYDKNMNKIGESTKLAQGETMYSSRFVGNKAYLVTYKTVDPLFVIDLSNPENPVVEGELKIPGYSTYLHPYDENHIIGIGMQTEEVVNRNYYTGKVTSVSAKITGMKMALFDVSDVNNPKQISEVTIGDRRTTSAILQNHKALLFSKEKNLLAIPVNNYDEDFEITTSTENYETIINAYNNKNTDYVSEGYIVYNINLTDGIKEKGRITHDYAENDSMSSYYYYYTKTRLLRGLYINNNLYTVSENQIKVKNLENLEEVGNLTIVEENKNNNYINIY